MKIATEPLVEGLQFAVSILKGKPSIPILSHVLMRAEDGRFTLVADSLSERVVCEAECGGELPPICVSASRLSNISALFSEFVTLNGNNGMLTVESGGKFGLGTLPASEFPAEPKELFTKLTPSCSVLADMIERVAFAAHPDESRAEIHGVHVELSAEHMIVDALNGKDYAICENSAIVINKGDFLIPLPTVKHFCESLKRDGALLSISDKRLRVQFNGGEYFCTLFEAKFPMDIPSQARKCRPESIGTINRAAWCSIFRAACGMEQDWPAMKVNDKLIEFVAFKSAESMSVPTPGELKPMATAINGKSFLACLSAFTEEQITLLLMPGDKYSPVFLDSPSLRTVSMPLRME